MKFKSAKIPLADIISRSWFVSFISQNAGDLFFKLVRTISKLKANKNGKVVILSLHKLGDTVFTIPAIEHIVAHYKKNIYIFCFPESVPIYKMAFNQIEFLTINKSDFYFGNRIANKKARKLLKNIKPEIIYDLTGWVISASLIFNSKTRMIIGTNKNVFKSIYDYFISPRIKPQLSDIYLDVVSKVIENSINSNTKTKSIIRNPDGKIIIHPFAAWKEKEWSFRNYFNLVLALKKNYSVALLTPSNSMSIDIQQELAKTNIELIQTNSIDELIDEIKNCSVMIGNDSGPINIGNYINVPTFTIYGATNSDYTTTGYVHHKHIQNSLKCSARENEKFCLIGGATYDCPGIQCMNLLTFNEVYSELNLLIEEYCEKDVRIKQ